MGLADNDNLVPKSTRSHGNDNKKIPVNVSAEEYAVFHSLPDEKKRLIRAIVKTLLANPELLDNAEFWQKFVILKSVSAYICPVCLTPFTSYRGMMHHLRYTNHQLKCGVCGKPFTDPYSLYDHFRKKHIGI